MPSEQGNFDPGHGARGEPGDALPRGSAQRLADSVHETPGVEALEGKVRELERKVNILAVFAVIAAYALADGLL